MNVKADQEDIAKALPWQPVQRNSPFLQMSHTMRKLGLGKWLAAGALIAVMGGYWYYNHMAQDTVRGPRVATAPVRIAQVQRGNMSVIERTLGTVVAYNTVEVTPQVAGRVQQAFFKEGQMVKKGDLLFQIDPRPFEAALGMAKGQLAKDQAGLDGAQRDLKRFQALMAVNAESQQVVDDQLATVASDQGIVEADKSNVQTAALNVEYTQIRSPVDGKTGPITVMPGNVISVTGTTTTVNPLVTITQIQPIKISFFLPQNDLPRIQARQKTGNLVATIDESDAGGTSFSVPVDFVGNLVNNATGTIELRATYPNADAALVPGQLVNVVVALADIPNATIVPHEALAADSDHQYVYKIVDGKAQQVILNVLFDDAKNAAVEGDLQPGDQVVVDGQLQVVPGGRVEVVQGAQAGAGNSGKAHKKRGADAKS